MSSCALHQQLTLIRCGMAWPGKMDAEKHAMNPVNNQSIKYQQWRKLTLLMIRERCLFT